MHLEVGLTARSCQYKRLRTRSLVIVGICLLSINSFCGMVSIYRSWPFALYPPFAISAKAQRESLEIVPLSSTGKTIPFDEQALKQKFSSDRFLGLTSSILGTGKALRQQSASNRFEGSILSILGSVDSPAQSRARLNALWQVAVQTDPNLQQADSVRFYKVTRWTASERQKEPIHQELIFELKL